MIQYISDTAHYNSVLARTAAVKRTLWIGTADIKDLHVKCGTGTMPFLGVVAQLLRKGVEVRLIHAKEPGPNFREDFDKYPILATGLERVLCPRVHFKMLVFDLNTVYVGSANLTGAGIGMKNADRRNSNLTGAGIGMKNADRRNFEAGILTDEPQLVEAAISQFDNVWIGRHCVKCGRKAFCHDQISKL